jgi:hypothetical protein
LSIRLVNPFIAGSVPAIGLDPDAAVYVAAVEIADGQSLEVDIALAISGFVSGCKIDSIWSAIKGCCILAGARTLAGALVPLVGTAPANVSSAFLSGDYNRETGLKGNGTSKRLDTGVAGNVDPLNSNHMSVYVSQANSTGFRQYIAANSGSNFRNLAYDASLGTYAFVNGASNTSTGAANTGFVGNVRSGSGAQSLRATGATTTSSISSTTAPTGNINLFSLSTGSNYGDGRIAFYSFGESLNIALLDARVTTLISAIGSAIP